MTVVVPTWNSARWLPGCLAALRAQTLEPEEVLVVDSASTDGTIEALGEGGSVRWLALSANRGFAAAANAGWRSARTPWVALLNPDTAPEAGWLRALAEALAASDARVWAIASKMLRMVDPDVVDDAGDSLTRFGAAVKRGHGEPERSWCEADDVLSPCAGAALYRRDVLEGLGGFDESFESYLEDLDLGLRARLAGWRCRFEPEARVLHQGGGSGLPRPHYVRLVTCNRLLLLLKDLPARLLVRHSLRLLRGQLYFLLAYHRPLASLQGYLRFLRLLPHTLRARRQVQGARRVAVEEVDGWLLRERGTPPLRSLLRRPG
ncbi:MAG: glycosyltransferase family 2 protein [Thermoanaerobaculia bacterium]